MQKEWQRADGQWGGELSGGGHAGTSHWGTPNMPPNHDLSGTAHWAQHVSARLHRVEHAQRVQQPQGGQWGAPPPMHAPPPHHRPPPPTMQQWNAPPQMAHGAGGVGHDSFRAPQSWDMNPQNPSMWVPPAPNGTSTFVSCTAVLQTSRMT